MCIILSRRCWLLIVLLGCNAVSEAASSRPYWLDISGTPEARKFRLRKRGTGKIIWMRTLGKGASIQWSANGRAVALFYKRDTRRADGLFDMLRRNHVLVWRAGHKLRTRTIGLDYDGVMGSTWSPDNQRLLFRVGGSGDGTLNLGALLCLDARNTSLHRIPGSTRYFKWANSRKVIYWTARSVQYKDYSGYMMNKTPNVWFAPK